MATQKPSYVDTVGGEWTLVAEDVTSASIYCVSNVPAFYCWTYVLTGEDPPDDLPYVRLSANGQGFAFVSSVDIYVYSVSGDGKVRVDVDAYML